MAGQLLFPFMASAGGAGGAGLGAAIGSGVGAAVGRGAVAAAASSAARSAARRGLLRGLRIRGRRGWRNALRYAKRHPIDFLANAAALGFFGHEMARAAGSLIWPDDSGMGDEFGRMMTEEDALGQMGALLREESMMRMLEGMSPGGGSAAAGALGYGDESAVRDLLEDIGRQRLSELSVRHRISGVNPSSLSLVDLIGRQ